LILERAQQLLPIEAFARTLQRQFRKRLETGFSAGVLAQSDQRRAPPFRWDLVVEQCAQAAENRLGRVDVRQQETLPQIEGLQPLMIRLDQDFEILTDEWIRFGREPSLQFLLPAREAFPHPRAAIRRQHRDLIVESLDADRRSTFRRKLRLLLQQPACVFIAAGDPCRCRLRRRRSGLSRQGQHRSNDDRGKGQCVAQSLTHQ
jgi:hypothetical protein